MRIAFTSDVHADVTARNGQLLPFLADAVRALAPDVFVLAGDTANDLAALDGALAAFEAVPGRKLLVQGNHDAWIESRKALRYARAIPEVSAAGATAVVAVLHTNPFAECLTRKPEPDPFDAYEGSLALGALLARTAAHTPVTAICGHRHQPLDVTVSGVRVLRSPVGYLDRAAGPLEEIARTAIGLVEVPDGAP